jgi:hypothetical protein
LESVETRLTGSVPNTRKKAEERGLEKEEEDYFNEDRFGFFFGSFVVSLYLKYMMAILFTGRCILSSKLAL